MLEEPAADPFPAQRLLYDDIFNDTVALSAEHGIVAYREKNSAANNPLHFADEQEIIRIRGYLRDSVFPDIDVRAGNK